MICTICLSEKTELKKPGSALITLILLCFYFIPGIIYMIWRSKNKKQCCAQCGSDQIIPVDSPNGMILVQKKYSLKNS